MNKQSGALPELPEAEATGRTKEIYEEIKYLSGVPMVALIYRHMATLPGVLEWGWEKLRPLMQSGLLQERAWKMANEATLPATLAIPRAARAAAGISISDEERIRASLSAFNRSNPINILALRCLTLHLSGQVASQVHGFEHRLERRHGGEWSPPVPVHSLPPMLNPSEMTPHAREIIDWLCHRGVGRFAGIWPSLYRHLANYPQFLGFTGVILPPLFNEIDAAVASLHEVIDRSARELTEEERGRRGEPAPSSMPSDSACEQLRLAINDFTLLIPEMVVVGALIERALPA